MKANCTKYLPRIQQTLTLLELGLEHGLHFREIDPKGNQADIMQQGIDGLKRTIAEIEQDSQKASVVDSPST